MKTYLVLLTVTLASLGCSSTSQLTLMPRDSGMTYQGVLTEQSDEGALEITVDDKTYKGTLVAHPSPALVPSAPYHNVYAAPWELPPAVAWQAKALLRTAQGDGMRCDLVRDDGVGSGVCLDDQGHTYDVQLRSAGR